MSCRILQKKQSLLDRVLETRKEAGIAARATKDATGLDETQPNLQRTKSSSNSSLADQSVPRPQQQDESWKRYELALQFLELAKAEMQSAETELEKPFENSSKEEPQERSETAEPTESTGEDKAAEKFLSFGRI